MKLYKAAIKLSYSFYKPLKIRKSRAHRQHALWWPGNLCHTNLGTVWVTCDKKGAQQAHVGFENEPTDEELLVTVS